MATETERKFLVHKDLWEKRDKPEGSLIRQGYITTDPAKTIRVRIKNDTAWLTIKGATQGFSRTEIEFPVPLEQAREMLAHFAGQEISKERFEIPYDAHTWEVDVFLGENEGLIVAEIELESETSVFQKPDWVAEEVTGDHRYYNAWLSEHPYCNW